MMKNLHLLRTIFLVLVFAVGFQCVLLLGKLSTIRTIESSSPFKTPKNERGGGFANNNAAPAAAGGLVVETTTRKNNLPSSRSRSSIGINSMIQSTTQSPSLMKMMMETKTKNSDNIIITREARQGFHVPKDLAEWNLPNFSDYFFPKKTICVAHQNRYIGPTENVFARFNILTRGWEWKFLLGPAAQSKAKGVEFDDACQKSLIRIFYEVSSIQPNGKKYFSRLKLNHLKDHTEGKQLTAGILGGMAVDKGSLATMVEDSSLPSSDLLKDAIPKTRVFENNAECIQFCNDEWYKSQPSLLSIFFKKQRSQQQQQWIWKPKFSSYGRGITGIGPTVKSCREYCINEGGDQITAQALMNNPMVLPNDDGRKFDIRSHIFVASVDPLIVYTGAEYVRICAEPFEASTTTTLPWSSSFTWNQFQQVCNMAVTKQHPDLGNAHPSTYVKPIGDEGIIEDDELRNHIINKLDQHDRALVELLYKERWTNPEWMNPNSDYRGDNNNNNRNKIGMFQILAADYLVADTPENEIVLLEVNSQPGFDEGSGVHYPNPWGDMLQIEWTILATYNKYKHSVGNDNNNNGDGGGEDWKIELEQRLSELELETLRRLQL